MEMILVETKIMAEIKKVGMEEIKMVGEKTATIMATIIMATGDSNR